MTECICGCGRPAATKSRGLSSVCYRRLKEARSLSLYPRRPAGRPRQPRPRLSCRCGCGREAHFNGRLRGLSIICHRQMRADGTLDARYPRRLRGPKRRADRCLCGCGRAPGAGCRGLAQACYMRLYREGGVALLDERYPRRPTGRPDVTRATLRAALGALKAARRG